MVLPVDRMPNEPIASADINLIAETVNALTAKTGLIYLSDYAGVEADADVTEQLRDAVTDATAGFRTIMLPPYEVQLSDTVDLYGCGLAGVDEYTSGILCTTADAQIRAGDVDYLTATNGPARRNPVWRDFYLDGDLIADNPLNISGVGSARSYRNVRAINANSTGGVALRLAVSQNMTFHACFFGLSPICVDITEGVKNAYFFGCWISGAIRDEKQTVTTTGGAGTFQLTFDGQTTAAISRTATADEVHDALVALSSIGFDEDGDSVGANNVTVTGGPLPAAVTVTFTNLLGSTNVPTMTTADSDVTIATTTQGLTSDTLVRIGYGTPGALELGPTWKQPEAIEFHGCLIEDGLTALEIYAARQVHCFGGRINSHGTLLKARATADTITEGIRFSGTNLRARRGVIFDVENTISNRPIDVLLRDGATIMNGHTTTFLVNDKAVIDVGDPGKLGTPLTARFSNPTGVKPREQIVWSNGRAPKGPPWSSDPRQATAAAALGATANAGRFSRVHGTGTVSKIAVFVGVSSGNVSAAVYTNTGAGQAGAPTTRLATSGAVPCPAAGYAEISLGASVYAEHEDHWFGFSCDNTTATFLRNTSSTNPGDLAKGWAGGNNTAHPLPDPAPSMSTSNVGVPVMVGVA